MKYLDGQPSKYLNFLGMKKEVRLRIDEDVYLEFLRMCKELGINVDNAVEDVMRNMIRVHKTFKMSLAMNDFGDGKGRDIRHKELVSSSAVHEGRGVLRKDRVRWNGMDI